MDVIWSRLPHLEQISDDRLRSGVKACFEAAIERGGWTEEEALRIPFTLLIPNCPVSLVDHTAAVTEIALRSAESVAKMYPRFSYDRDALIAGAILHDVGKFLEYTRTDEGFVKSDFGKLLRHPFSGAALAYEFGLPPKVVHIIAVHAKEGDSGYRCPEAVIVNKADFITFESLKAALGIK